MALNTVNSNKKQVTKAIDDFTDIMLLAKQGDHKAFEHIYTEYITPIFRYIYYRVSNKVDADDLVQVVFLKLFENLKNWEPRQTPLAYVYTIARHTVIDYWRKNGREYPQTDIMEFDIIAHNDNLDDKIDRDKKFTSVLEAINTLPQNYQDILILRFVNDFTTTEIAEQLDKKEATVRKIQSRGLQKLKEILADE